MPPSYDVSICCRLTPEQIEQVEKRYSVTYEADRMMATYGRSDYYRPVMLTVGPGGDQDCPVEFVLGWEEDHTPAGFAAEVDLREFLASIGADCDGDESAEHG